MRVPACCLALLCAATLTAAACAAPLPSVTAPAATISPNLRWPSEPITSRAGLDAYVRDTPADASPLSAFTQAGRRRFLASLVFHERGLGGFGTDELRYDLTRTQAWSVLRLFGAERYAETLAARTVPRPAAAAPATLDGAYDDLAAPAPPGHEAALLGNVYAREFSPAQQRLGSLVDRDVELLFRSADWLMHVASSPQAYLVDMRRDFAELERRHRVDRPHADALYRALLAAHLPGDARALLSAYPILDRSLPPTLHDAKIKSGLASIWAPRGHDLWRQPLPLNTDAQIVVLGSTGCHFSEAAARSIDADPALRELFRAHARWVAPAQDIVAFDAVKAWNRAHPAQPLAILYDDAGLSFIGHLATPTFYFLRHGQVVAAVVGWPGDTQRKALRQGLQQIGLHSRAELLTRHP